MLAVLLCGGMLVWGWLRPAPNTAWKQQGAIVVDQSSGTRYIYLNGVLHPVANYASALLIAGRSAAVNYLPAASLSATRVGDTIGISGAPDSLPSPSALLRGTWALCHPAAYPGAIALDLDPPARTTVVGARRLLAETPGGSQYLIWNDVKYPVPAHSALIALGLSSTSPEQVPLVWLEALPTGPALAAPEVAGARQRGPVVAGQAQPVGQLFQSTAAGVDQYFVLLRDGLAPISRTVLALFLTVSQQSAPMQLSTAQIAAAPASADRAMLTSLPDMLAGPVFAPSQGALCVRQRSPGSPASSTVVTENLTRTGVIIPSGVGMIVSSASQSYLITGAGRQYALIGSAAQALGYGSAAPNTMPAAVLHLVPSGPPLSPAWAQQPIPDGA